MTPEPCIPHWTALLSALLTPMVAGFAVGWMRIDPEHPSIEEKLDSRGAQFCTWTKAERNAKFAGLLTSFDPMYEVSYPYLVRNGEAGLVAPKVLDVLSGTDWPDPRWS